MLPLTLINAQNPSFTISSSLNHVSLGEHIEILEDKTGDLTINDITSPKILAQFFTSNEEEPNFGFTSSVYWVKLTINNTQNKTINWFLEIGYPLLDYIELYVPEGEGDFIIKKTGDQFPFSSREVSYRNFIFHLSENPNSTKTYYLRFQSSSSMNFPLVFWLKDTFFEKNTTEMTLLGIFYGAVIIMIIYNIFLYIGFLDKSFLYLVFFITSWGLTQLSLNGLAFQYIWPNWIWWANINIPFFIFATVFATNQFGRSLLITSKNSLFWDKIIKVENILFLSGIVLSLLLSYAITIRFAAAAAMTTVIILFLTTISCIRKKVRSAYFYIVAWGFYFFGVILFALKSFGVLPSNFLTNWSIQIGAFALIVLFSIAVQDRINKERKEKYLAQRSALENEQKLVKTLRESERILEGKVKERTKKLSEKNVVLNKKTKELQESANELDTLDNIVKIINREFEFSKVVNTLLEQGLNLFPQAQQGAALIYDPETERYHFIAAVGYDLEVFKKTSMTIDDLQSTFGQMTEEVVKGIFIVRQNGGLNKDVVFNLTNSKTVMAMSISLEGDLAGFLLFDNNTKSDAFDQSDAHRLSRFRSHAISAFAKATLLLEMKKATAQIMKTQDQLLVQEKMANLGQVTAGIAHEIKNPLNFVNNFAEGSVELVDELIEMLDKQKDHLKEGDFDEIEEIVNELKQNASDIFENGKRADRIVRSMMDHARGEKGERKLTNINMLVDENINLAYHGYRAIDSSFNANIKKNYDEALEAIEVVHQDIGRVLLNILNNACYALKEKQKVNNEEYSPEISVSTKSLKKEVEIRIRDNGPGIPEKVRDKIFNPFFTTKPTGEGNTGLGLSISFDIIVQQHHGKLEVESKPNGFTEFLIQLPKSKNRK